MSCDLYLLEYIFKKLPPPNMAGIELLGQMNESLMCGVQIKMDL